MKDLYWNTVKPILKVVLQDIITEPIFAPFRLVGGTSLSLQTGHRMSVDIDLFTDAEYGSIDYKAIREFLEIKYPFCSSRSLENVSFGTYFIVGTSEMDCVKIDLYYTDDFIEPPLIINEIRMATINEIIAMKLDVVLRGGRKKDFWDLHYFIDKMNVDEMITLFQKRYPYTEDYEKIKEQLIFFEEADTDFEPNCLLGKNWEIIKLDFYEFVNQ
ncbi:nucleotidyl transferase AbiEii/AbiGii toxin family protein [Flavobacterium sp. GA093]|uniref:Nucleotidyl transferase AbiEii/AbiGii toxin family protein n=1 Tax=Flavobacterium hydrocarbonoxydans TaxID=2683249 RepID=A0A6I4NM23_9FLAO|nr:nucleotidyl transferase AbiEii/AbiGii toxin family protein [Flavobacterium hydrocarbonoxydans]MWB95221.1 nucleotidyl transferase AbiEii/AbiGii toxin family protein [Flavobacterium hydrocarbonoxydans]